MFRTHHITGCLWFITSLIWSCLNDIVSKYLSHNLAPAQVVFGRFFFATLVMIAFLIIKKCKIPDTSRLLIHMMRGLMLAVAMCLWNFGIKLVLLPTITLMSFTMPIFLLILAPIFLNERSDWKLWMAALVGFIGIVVTLDPSSIEFNSASLTFITATAIFASLDIINKLLINKREGNLSMLFYSSFFSCIFGMYPAVNNPNFFSFLMNFNYDLMALICLGIGGNLILYCTLKAFQYTAASALGPLRYLELVLSVAAGYFIFAETPSVHMILGATLIISSSFFIMQYKSKA